MSIAENSIEERVVSLQVEKKELVDKVISNDDYASKNSEENTFFDDDIDALSSLTKMGVFGFAKPWDVNARPGQK